MSHELYYTSAPAGLKPGSNGFCTVAATAGLPGATAQRLEMLSGYRDLYPLGDSRTGSNPVAYAHWRLSAGVRAQSVLSRVCSAGMDYSGRSNTFAHHLLLDPAEQPPAGPAWVLSQSGVLDVAWTGSPRTIPTGRSIPRADNPPAVCNAWAIATGDAGWAGVLAAAAAADAPRVAYLIYDPNAGHDPLPLLREAMALLPAAQRWAIAFATYFTDLPAGLACHWRCCVAGTPAAKEARRHATSGVVLDLTTQLGDVPDTALVLLARTGQAQVPAVATVAAALTPFAAGAHAEEDAAVPEVVRPLPLPVGAAAIGRLTPRPPLAIPFGSNGTAAKALPSLPIATLVADDHDSPMQAVGKPRTWLWVAAFVWPLLVIAAAAAWCLMASQEMTDRVKVAVTGAQGPLQERIKAQDKTIDTLEREKYATAAALAQAESRANQLPAVREDAKHWKAESEHQAGSAAKLRVQWDALNAQSKVNKAAVSAAQPAVPTTTPAGTPPTAPVEAPPVAKVTAPAPATAIPLFDDPRHTILDASVGDVKSIQFLNPFKVAGIQTEPTAGIATPNGGPPKLTLKLPTVAGGAPQMLGSISIDPEYGLVFSQTDLPATSVRDARDALDSCGVRITTADGQAHTFQLGEPLKEVKLSQSSKSQSIIILRAGQHIPVDTEICAGGTPEDEWICSGPHQGSGVLHIYRNGPPQPGLASFAVTFDAGTASLWTDWTENYKTLSTRKTEDDRNSKQQEVVISEENKEIEADSVAPSSESNSTREARLTTLRDARSKHDTAYTAKRNADEDSKVTDEAIKELNKFRSFTLRFIDPNTGLTLRVVKLVKN